MSGPEWLDIDLGLDFHAEQLALFGGADGIRDRALLDSALARPINKFGYGETNFAALAVAYGYGIARNHSIIDGNKRTALAAIMVFLGLNEIDFDAPPVEATASILGLAAGEITEEVLAAWIADHTKRLDAPGFQL